MKTITKEKLEKYFKITQEAYEMARKNPGKNKETFDDFIDMISRYISDAKYFEKNQDFVNAFAALSYAHGWLDAGARSKIFLVKDNRLFTVD